MYNFNGGVNNYAYAQIFILFPSPFQIEWNMIVVPSSRQDANTPKHLLMRVKGIHFHSICFQHIFRFYSHERNLLEGNHMREMT